jgi:hypothetical protein
MLLGLDPNGGTGMSEEWAARLAIEELKNRWQELLIARGLLNGRTRWDAQISECHWPRRCPQLSRGLARARDQV